MDCRRTAATSTAPQVCPGLGPAAGSIMAGQGSPQAGACASSLGKAFSLWGKGGAARGRGWGLLRGGEGEWGGSSPAAGRTVPGRQPARSTPRPGCPPPRRPAERAGVSRPPSLPHGGPARWGGRLPLRRRGEGPKWREEGLSVERGGCHGSAVTLQSISEQPCRASSAREWWK